MSRTPRFYNTENGIPSTTATDEEGHPFVSRREADWRERNAQDESMRKSGSAGNAAPTKYVNGGSARPQRGSVPRSYQGVNQGRVGRNY